MAKAQFPLAEVENKFRPGMKVKFRAGSNKYETVAVVKAVRQTGEPGSNGHLVFVDTVEDLGPRRKPKIRSICPGNLEFA